MRDVQMWPRWINGDKRYIIIENGEVHSTHADRTIAADVYKELMWGNEVEIDPRTGGIK